MAAGKALQLFPRRKVAISIGSGHVSLGGYRGGKKMESTRVGWLFWPCVQ